MELPTDGVGRVREWMTGDGVGLKTPAQIMRDFNNALIEDRLYFQVLSVDFPLNVLRYVRMTQYDPRFNLDSIFQKMRDENIMTRETGKKLAIVPVDESDSIVVHLADGGSRVLRVVQ